MNGTRGWTFRLVTGLAVAGALLLSSPVYAQDGYSEVEAAPQGPNAGKVGLKLGFDFVSEYHYRGITQANSGVIFQPYAEVSFTLFEELGPVENITAFTGLWNSLHTRPKGTGNNASAWNEADWYIGVGADLPFGISTSLSYSWRGNPNGSFNPGAGGADSFAEQIDWEVAYDDTAFWEENIGMEGFSLQPYVLFSFEIGGGSDGNRPNSSSGGYLEIGLTPSYVVLRESDYPVTLSLPIAAGFGLYDYYEFSATEEMGFGFFDVGIEASTPLAFIPSDYGQWEAHVGFHIIMLQNTGLSDQKGEAFYVTAGMSMKY